DDDGQDPAADPDDHAARVHLHRRALPHRPRPLLDDDEPLDGGAGPHHPPADPEDPSAAEAVLPHPSAERRGRRRERGQEAGDAAAAPTGRDEAAPARTAEEGQAQEADTAVSTREVRVETTGETVGEAKWAALRELEKEVPELARSAVRFVVLAEGERG